MYSVFWDLYCAAPERRDTCDHSSEAKAFHDYVSISMHAYCTVLECYIGRSENGQPIGLTVH